jgi:shikimate kinase/shikimate 5-dehydrogenase
MKPSSKYLDLYAVAGNPIAHSKSPVIFNNLFAKENISAYYSRIQASSFEGIQDLIETYELKGINVTSPFKEDAYRLSNQDLGNNTRILQSINTIVSPWSYNTDVEGVKITLLENNLDKMENCRVLIFGTGPAARSAAAAAIDVYSENATYFVYSGSEDRAKEFKELYFKNFEPQFDIENAISEADLIINCSTNVDNNDLESVSFAGKVVLDANYANSQFEKQVKETGGTFISGESWLINQAIESYYYFTREKINNVEDKWSLLVDKDKRNDTNYGAVSRKPITLIGFMGAGKTEAGKLTAHKLGLDFTDIDEEIERQCGKSISDIFKEDGEKKFREIESKILEETISSRDGIISSGGGIVENSYNRKLLLEKSWPINLHVSPEFALKRIDISNRPMLWGEDPQEKAYELFNNRKYDYFTTSQLTVNTNEIDLNEVCEVIEQAINVVGRDDYWHKKI